MWKVLGFISKAKELRGWDIDKLCSIYESNFVSTYEKEIYNSEERFWTHVDLHESVFSFSILEKRRSGKSLIFLGFSSFIPSFILYSFLAVQVVDFASKDTFNVSTTTFTTTIYYKHVLWCKKYYNKMKKKW